MPTLENVINIIKESINGLEKALISISVKATSNDHADPLMYIYPDMESAKKASGEGIIPAILTPKPVHIKLYPRFVCVPRELALEIISLVKILQKNVESTGTPITQLSFEGENIPIKTMWPYKKLNIAIKDLETLASCNIETVHGSKLPDPKVNPDNVL